MYYFLISHSEHSCIPNAIVRFRENATAYLVALRPIRKGEEIFHSYIENEDPYEDRAEELLDPYGFICDCPKCIEERK